MIATFESGSRSVLRAAALPVATATLFAAGCGVVRPTVSASEMRLGETTADATKVGIVLELVNPGRDEVELVRYDYSVILDDGARYDGVWSAQRALPPGRPVEAVIPAVLPSASVARAAGIVHTSSDLDYYALGTIAAGKTIFVSATLPATSSFLPVVAVYNSSGVFMSEINGSPGVSIIITKTMKLTPSRTGISWASLSMNLPSLTASPPGVWGKAEPGRIARR
jgi:hypothetical protein